MGSGAVQEVTSGYVNDHLVEITKNGNHLDVFVKGSSIRIEMTWIQGLWMRFRVCVPHAFCEIAEGHLGHCDNSRPNSTPRQNDC